MTDLDRMTEIATLLNGEGRCARCDEQEFSLAHEFRLGDSGLFLYFCSQSCQEAFVRGIGAAGELKVL